MATRWSSRPAPAARRRPSDYNQATIQEISVQTGATSAEQQTSGIVSNIIPKEGSNALTGYLTASYSGDALAGRQPVATTCLRTGLTSVSGLISLWEVTPAIGGRIVRDKLWFYSAFRAQSTNQSRAGLYQDIDPKDWALHPGPDPAAAEQDRQSGHEHPADVAGHPEEQVQRVLPVAELFPAPSELSESHGSNEATNITKNTPNTFGQAVWKSPRDQPAPSRRRILDLSLQQESAPPGRRGPHDGSGARSSAASTPGIFFRSAPFNSTDLTYGRWDNGSFDYSGSASFITGSHAFKTGVLLPERMGAVLQ